VHYATGDSDEARLLSRQALDVEFEVAGKTLAGLPESRAMAFLQRQVGPEKQ
jgi:hypothetical protein